MYCRFLSGMQKSNIFAFNLTLAAIYKIIFNWRPGSKLGTMDQHVNFIMIGVQYRLQGVTMYNVQYMYINIVQCTKIGLQYRFQGVTHSPYLSHQKSPSTQLNYLHTILMQNSNIASSLGYVLIEYMSFMILQKLWANKWYFLFLLHWRKLGGDFLGRNHYYFDNLPVIWGINIRGEKP